MQKPFFDRRHDLISAGCCLAVVVTYFQLGPLLFFTFLGRLGDAGGPAAFFFFIALCVGCVMAWTYGKGGWSPLGLGFRWPATTWILWGLGLGVLIQIATGILGLGVSEAGQEALAEFNQNYIVGATPTLFSLLGLVIVVCILVPVLEETLFRGIFYIYLKERFGDLVGAGGSTVLFAFAHAATLSVLQNWWDQALVLALLALVGFAALRLRVRSGSLYPAIALHATYNTTALIAPLFEP